MKHMMFAEMKLRMVLLFMLLMGISAMAQTKISGKVTNEGEPLPFANVYISQLDKVTITDGGGTYTL